MATSTHARRDLAGSVFGIGVFLGGVAMLLVTFNLAYHMFAIPPGNALDLKPGKPLEVATVGNSLMVIIERILLLLIMGVVGSLVANKGIFMYTHSRAMHPPADPKDATVS